MSDSADILFETERLYARKLTRADLFHLCIMQGDPDVMRHITPRPKSASESAAELTKILQSYQTADHRFLVLAVALKANGRFLGTCAVIDSEIGFRLCKRAWGQGYGKEICAGLLSFCRFRLQLDEVTAIVDTDNAACVKILDSAMEFISEDTDETGRRTRMYRTQCGKYG